MSDSNKWSISLNVNLLTILFIGLKLTHYIDWSWWWVLAPTWIPFAGFMILYIIWFLVNVFWNR